MSDPYNLRRFVEAQDSMFEGALAELRSGAKRSHWMWFIFPQLSGLGRSLTAQHYAIASIDEARAYLQHPLLGPRLHRAVKALLPWAGRRSAEQILGPIDAVKLKSSLTLFDRVEPGAIFERALAALYDGAPDQQTLALLNLEA
ncbi:MAG: DUF1810 domain-containing protein [Sphingomicrobium sp.]